MRYALLTLVLTGLLLCGCAAQAEPEPTLPPPTQTSTEPVPAQPLYLPGSKWEQASAGALRAFRPGAVTLGIFPWGEDLVLAETGEEGTFLQVYRGDPLLPAARVRLPEECSLPVRHSDGSLICFAPDAGLLRWDSALNPLPKLPLPEGLQGAPCLSPDGKTLYYCTADALRALETDSGISRIVAQCSYPGQRTLGLLLDGSVVWLCHDAEDGGQSHLFLSARNGALLGASGLSLSGSGWADRYYLTAGQLSLFGRGDTSARLLSPRRTDGLCRFLPNANAAITVSYPRQGSSTAELYELDSGLCTAAVEISDAGDPCMAAADGSGKIWLLFRTADGTETLFCWDSASSPTGDTACYTSVYSPEPAPDPDTLALCLQSAAELSGKYGLQILTGAEAAALAPPGGKLVSQDHPDVLRRQLEVLEGCLSAFPEGFLQALERRFSGIRICLVSSISAGTDAPEASPTGLLFWQENLACIALTAQQDMDYALYHQLCHLIDTAVLTESTAYDRWEILNPSDFAYDLDYTANRTRDGSPWLKPGKESFLDTFSMSYPKEDRARILEYAMTPGNEARFRSVYLQAKLTQICTGIREAFDLEGSPEIFLWEQYLDVPLAYIG